ncbi:hypothetical protein CBR_g29724 [Chara braunii]|uniref:Uncharacterized protein n=1 Tax=Chara braunii TaxID=69332 RepID=A0A388LB73_CHABU|nr:hypothetical protein CBR_g29724 [Chara braunii]|eukprot:GBG79577.1 hypothetical protein CBR_g29724 [Chara braunii]
MEGKQSLQGGGLEKRRQPAGEEVEDSCHAGELRLQRIGDLDWVENFGYRTELPEEPDEERDQFVAKLAAPKDREKENLLIEENKSGFNQKLLTARRKKFDEKKGLKEEEERLQVLLKEQEGKQVETEERWNLLTDTLLHTTQELYALQRAIRKVERHQEEFGSTETASSQQIDHRIMLYTRQLDFLFTQKLANTISAKLSPDGGDGDGGDDGDGDKKGKGPMKDGGKKGGEDTFEGGERMEKMKVKPHCTYTQKREENIFHWDAAIDT